MSTPSFDRTDGAYGADDCGLICGFVFDPHASAPQPVNTRESLAWLQARAEQPPGAFLWLHFNLAHNGSERWLRQHAGVSEAFYEALHDGSHSSRIEHVDDRLIAVLNDVHFDFSYDPSDISTLWVEAAPHLMVSARRQPLRSIDRLRTAVRGGAAPSSTVELLVHLLRDQGDVLVAIVRSLNVKANTIEDTLLAGRVDGRASELGALRRLIVRLQRVLAPEPAALVRMLQHPPGWIVAGDVQDIRAAGEEFAVVLRDMAALQERIKLLQEEIATVVNEENNRSLFILTIVTVLVLPINIVSGLLGMNVGGLPLAQHPHGFWIILGVVVAITVVAAWIIVARIRRRMR